MVEKLYLALWGIFFAAFALFFLTGFMTAAMVVGFGFVAFGMVFLGMIGILPHYVTHYKIPLEH
ncbi:MAG: hypothetical protein R2681_03665 [Pyrinomonadaceae bacterium]